MGALVFGVEPEIDVLVIPRDAFFEPAAMRTGEYFFVDSPCLSDHFFFDRFHEFLPDKIFLKPIKTHEFE